MENESSIKEEKANVRNEMDSIDKEIEPLRIQYIQTMEAMAPKMIEGALESEGIKQVLYKIFPDVNPEEVDSCIKLRKRAQRAWKKHSARHGYSINLEGYKKRISAILNAKRKMPESKTDLKENIRNLDLDEKLIAILLTQDESARLFSGGGEEEMHIKDRELLPNFWINDDIKFKIFYDFIGGCSCGKCYGERESFIEEFGLEELVEENGIFYNGLGQRHFSLRTFKPGEILKRFIENIVKNPEYGSELQAQAKELKKLESEFKSRDSYLESKWQKLRDKLKTLETIEKLEEQGLEKNILETNPDLKKCLDKGNYSAISIFSDGTFAVLQNGQSYAGTGGTMYYVDCIVNNGKGQKMERFVWRDAQDPNKDNASLAFDNLKIQSVDGGLVRIILSKKGNINVPSNEITRTYELPCEEKNRLSPEEAKKFEQAYKSHKEKLIDILEVKGEYRKIFGSNNPILPGTLIQESSAMVPYDSPSIISEELDSSMGFGVVVVKRQIDFTDYRGKQFQWAAYKITSEGVKMLNEVHAYEDDIRNGLELKIPDAKELACHN